MGNFRWINKSVPIVTLMFAVIVSFILVSFSTTIVSFVTVIVLPVTTLFVVVGSIDFIVPVVFNKIYRLTTGIILAAVLLPVLLMTGRYTQVDWLDRPTPRHRLYDYRLWVDIFRPWSVPYVNATIEARLPYANGYANIGC